MTNWCPFRIRHFDMWKSRKEFAKK